MGSGTLVDGVRRWFQQRRSSSTSSSTAVTANTKKLNRAIVESKVVVTELDAQSSTFQQENQEKEDLKITEDLELSGLKLIKVPNRTIRFTSMDPHKKVLYIPVPKTYSNSSLTHSLSLCC